MRRLAVIGFLALLLLPAPGQADDLTSCVTRYTKTFKSSLYLPAVASGRYSLSELYGLKQKMLAGLQDKFCAGFMPGHTDQDVQTAFEAELARE